MNLKPFDIQRPDYYTMEEGGAWMKVENFLTLQDMLAHREPELLAADMEKSVLSEYDAITIDLTRFRVHSLLWGDPATLAVGLYARWDAVNGWTNKATRIHK